ncbi:MAG: DUF6504 family protein [Actinomycetota bacterium]|nr:DUF6504 family protein [Actinomycetota bacterium]
MRSRSATEHRIRWNAVGDGRERFTAFPVSKRYEEDIEVTPDPSDRHLPVAFIWRGRRYEIDQRLSSWLESGEWWHAARNGSPGRDDAPRDREYFRVLARPAGMFATGDLDPDGYLQRASAVYDLFFDRVGHHWKLARIWD